MNLKRKNYIIIVILILAFIMMLPNHILAEEKSIMLGDINGDQKIDTSDSIAMLRHISAQKTGKHPEWLLTEEQILAGDVTKDGKIDSSDILIILRYIAADKNNEIATRHSDWLNIEREEREETEEVEQEINPEKVEISNDNIELEVGKTATITATVKPDNATNKTITWSSSNNDVATVDSKGLVTAKKEGTATITVSTTNGKTADCKVTVKNPVIQVTGVKLNKTTLNLEEKNQVSLTATVEPTNASDKTVTWSSSNNDVATVDSKGLVTATKEGTATITVKTANGKTATCKVTVKNLVVPVNSINLDKTSLTIYKSETQKLVATVGPTNATNKSITWKSSDSSVVSVSSTGTITAKGLGTAVVIASSTANARIYTTCKVTVKSKYSVSSTTKPTSVNGDGYSQKIKLAGRTFKLYKQYEGSYCNMPFNSLGRTGGTITGMGCAPSSLTIILSGYGCNYNPYQIGRKLTAMPEHLNSSSEYNHTSSIYNLAAVAKKLGRKVVQHQGFDSNDSRVYTQMRNALADGHQIVLNVAPRKAANGESKLFSKSRHDISILGIDLSNDKVFVGNPGTTGTKKNGWFNLSTLVAARGSGTYDYVGWLEVY